MKLCILTFLFLFSTMLWAFPGGSSAPVVPVPSEDGAEEAESSAVTGKPAPVSAPVSVEKVKPADPKTPECLLMRKSAFTKKGMESLKANWMTPYGFKWNDEKNSVLVWSAKKNKNAPKKLQLFGESVLSAVLTPEGGRLVSADFVILAEGESAPMMREPYIELVKKMVKGIRGLTGIKETVSKAKTIPPNQLVYEFDCGNRYWRVVCGFKERKKVTPQFLKCSIYSKTVGEPIDELVVVEEWVKLASLVKSVKKDEEGATFIDKIPMVEQGETPNACAASIARLFQYYGRDINLKETMEILGENVSIGKDPKALDAALESLKNKLKLNVSPNLYVLNQAAYRRLADAYNKDAVKRRMPELTPEELKVYALEPFNPSLLRTLNGNKTNVNKVKRILTENIDKGIPLVWVFELGMYQEKGKEPEQETGNHVRLIIGYQFDIDPEKEMILFSDAWGRGYEKKSMRLDDAVSATRRIFSIRPAK